MAQSFDPAHLTVELPVNRREELFVSDDRRVITRYLDFGDPARVRSILARLVRLSPAQAEELLEATLHDFSPRHRDVLAAFRDNFAEVAGYLPAGTRLSETQQLMIGAYFTSEYSIESAALFNPSIVPDPDHGHETDSEARFLMSLRATGEGHVSSIVFHRGAIGADGAIRLDSTPRWALSAKPRPAKPFEKRWLIRRLAEIGADEDVARLILAEVPDPFSLAHLHEAVDRLRVRPDRPANFGPTASELLWLARANYSLSYPPDCAPQEIVLFPATEAENRGMEDLRLVCFQCASGEPRYLGTYTAYDGRRILPMLLETRDFHEFHIRTLSGRYARNKGQALFPRQVDGEYLMVSRHDGESLYLLRSDSLYRWERAERLQEPVEPWELTQIGNAGPPIETEAGWLLLTHGVGPVRRYCIGAMLLDLSDPVRVLGRLRHPLLVPTPAEREGYVPNVVYSCGAMVHRGTLVIPYAVSDVATKFATVPLSALVQRLLDDGP
ncbi:MAG: glycoside hydrolase family 130 protein [Phycisphaeraceae bacterium]